MKAALDKRCVGGNKYHTNSILQAIKLSKMRMIIKVECYEWVSPSEIDNNGALCITNEDTAMEAVLEGICPDKLTNGGPIEEVSRALVTTEPES